MSTYPSTSRPPARPRWLALLFASFLVLVVGACSSSDMAGTSGDDSAADAAWVGDQQSSPDAAGDGSIEREAAGESGTTDTSTPVQPMLVRRLTMDILVEDVTDAVSRARATVIGVNGWVSSQDVRPATETRPGRASLVLRVPAAELDGVEETLSELGVVTLSQDTAQDVTTEYRDVDARIRTLEASAERLRDLISEAGSVDSIVGLERELASREADLDALKARMQVLSEDVARSTITLHLAEESEDLEQTGPRTGFVGGLQSGWEAFLGSIAVLLTALGAILPFAVAAAVLLIPVLWWRRRRGTTRRTAKAREATPSASAPTAETSSTSTTD